MNRTRAFLVTTCAAFWVLVGLTIIPPLVTPKAHTDEHPVTMRCIPWKDAAEFHDSVTGLCGCPELNPREANT